MKLRDVAGGSASVSAKQQSSPSVLLAAPYQPASVYPGCVVHCINTVMTVICKSSKLTPRRAARRISTIMASHQHSTPGGVGRWVSTLTNRIHRTPQHSYQPNPQNINSQSRMCCSLHGCTIAQWVDNRESSNTRASQSVPCTGFSSFF